MKCIDSGSCSRYGDKRTELVFISRDLDKEALRKRLENALVTDEEFQLGPKGWEKFIKD